VEASGWIVLQSTTISPGPAASSAPSGPSRASRTISAVEAGQHDRRAARGVGGGAGRHAAPRDVLAHPLGRDVVAAHREAGPDQVLGEGRPQQAHADARDGLAHGRVLLGRHHTASRRGPH
jgi:hypothetical protein